MLSSTPVNEKKDLQTVHMFDMLIYISFLFGIVLRFLGGAGEVVLIVKRCFEMKSRRPRHKHAAVIFPHLIQLVKGILRGQKVYLAKD